MKLFITDNPDSYERAHGAEKVLVVGGVIERTALIPEKSRLSLNINGSAAENECAEEMLLRLKRIAPLDAGFLVSPALHRHSSFDRTWALLYPNFKLYLLPALHFIHTVKTLLKTLNTAPAAVEFDLSDDLSLVQYENLGVPCKLIYHFRKSKTYRLGPLKKSFYHLFSLFRKSPKRIRNKTHILLFMYDTMNDIGMFRHFCRKAITGGDVHISIVQLTSGNPKGKTVSAMELKSPSVDVYRFQDFRCSFTSYNDSFYDWITRVDPSYALFGIKRFNDQHDVYLAFAGNAIRLLQPSVVMYDNLAEAGRAVSDAAAVYAIPSVNVEYGLFTDDAIHMESRIKFSARACIGEASAALWKKRDDPSGHHASIGFLKLDELKDRWFNRDELLKKYGIPPGKKILFFASTWSAGNKSHDYEKRELVRLLAEFCRETSIILLIKKHPSEFDTILDELFNIEKFSHAFLFKHEEIDLYDAIFLSDVCSSQASSISVEALYMKKPVLFFSLSEENSLAELSLMKDEPFCRICKGRDEIASGIRQFMDVSVPDPVYEAAIRKYLYKNDGQAWKRLLELCTSLSMQR